MPASGEFRGEGAQILDAGGGFRQQGKTREMLHAEFFNEQGFFLTHVLEWPVSRITGRSKHALRRC